MGSGIWYGYETAGKDKGVDEMPSRWSRVSILGSNLQVTWITFLGDTAYATTSDKENKSAPIEFFEGVHYIHGMHVFDLW